MKLLYSLEEKQQRDSGMPLCEGDIYVPWCMHAPIDSE